MAGDDEDPTFFDHTEPLFDPTTRRVPRLTLAGLAASSVRPEAAADDDEVGPTRLVRPLAGGPGRRLADRRLRSIDGPTETFGRYTLLGAIGRGGMAEVRLAAETRPDGSVRLCVLKRAPAGAAPELTEALREEGRICRMLRHPNIVELYEAGVAAGSPYLTFELIDGVSLRELLDLLAPERLPLAAVLELGVQAASALAYAHAATDDRGAPLAVVHRDVTPQNVLVDRSGRVKVVDFGIARFSGRGLATRHGMVKGKLGYLAPEQLRGRVLDGRTDVFTLGLVLVELIAGRPVLPRVLMLVEALEPAVRACLAEAPHPVPPLVSEYLVRMTQLDVEARGTAAEAARELERIRALTEPRGTLAAFVAREIFPRLLPLELTSIVEGRTTRAPRELMERTEPIPGQGDREEPEVTPVDDDDGGYATTVRVARLTRRPPR